jgi:two-component system copper resistance phosphate regulon response regulator CusR
MKVLIVEDEAKTADYLRKGLAELSYIVDVADNGIDGKHLGIENDYDANALDLMLPGMDRFAILEGVRRLRQTPMFTPCCLRYCRWAR